MEKTLVLFTDKDAYYFGGINAPNIDIDQIFDRIAFDNNIFLKILRKLKSPFTRLFYREWYRNLKSYNKVIVLDATFQFDSSILRNIRRKNPNIKGYFYSWNIVRDYELYQKERMAVEQEGFKFYSYDLGDCKKYGMLFNTIMYDINLSLPTARITNDMFFLGYLKDRKNVMRSLYSDIIKAGYRPRFVIVNKGDYQSDLPFEFSEKYIDYFEYLSMLNESRSILDIAQNEQDGFSMRVMEAIFLDKKLITTNQAVRKAPFFNEKNIFIIESGKTDVSKLRVFFQTQLEPYSYEIKEYYSFEKWVERFE